MYPVSSWARARLLFDLIHRLSINEPSLSTTSSSNSPKLSLFGLFTTPSCNVTQKDKNTKEKTARITSSLKRLGNRRQDLQVTLKGLGNRRPCEDTTTLAYPWESSRRTIADPVSTSVARIEQSGEPVRIAICKYINHERQIRALDWRYKVGISKLERRH